MKTPALYAGQILDNPLVWETSRIGLDLTFGLYRKRFKLMHRWDVLNHSPAVLDIGCGIGQYSQITEGSYLGLDLNRRYIEYASKRHRKSNQTFRCQDVREIRAEGARYDVVLMVDFLHHIADENCVNLLQVAAHLARRFIVSFEPVAAQQHPIGRWIIEHDRGDHIRSLESLHNLFREAGITIAQSTELRLGPINTRAILAVPPGREQAL